MSSQLAQVARAMVAPGKGILAADESIGTANKRFAPLGIPETEEMRRKYRDLLFATPNFGEFFSGVILFDETIRQNADSGQSFAKEIADSGALVGIKLDKGTVPLALSPREKYTEGLDGLPKRVEEYVGMGAKFAKWRAVIEIADGLPTTKCIRANAQALARYAAICQQGGLVPIVEPEILMDGDHTLERDFDVHETTLRIVFDELATAGVAFEEMVLKPGMVLPGEKAPQQASVEQVADATLTVLLRWVPAAVAGIAFLSGGQGDELATEHLNAINVAAAKRHAPWPLTFSYGRALQQPALLGWKGNPANVEAARAALYHRAKMNGAAQLGKYTAAMENDRSFAGVAG